MQSSGNYIYNENDEHEVGLSMNMIRFANGVLHYYCFIIAQRERESERTILIEFFSLFQCNFWEKGVSLSFDRSTRKNESQEVENIFWTRFNNVDFASRYIISL